MGKQFFVTNKLQYLSLFQTAHSSEVSLLKLPASLGLRLVIFSSQHQFTFEQKQIVPILSLLYALILLP